MTDAQIKEFIGKLAVEEHYISQVDAFTAGATHPKIAGMWRAEGRIEAIDLICDMLNEDPGLLEGTKKKAREFVAEREKLAELLKGAPDGV